jgi:hypothetical protein
MGWEGVRERQDGKNVTGLKEGKPENERRGK